jgi:hypothetical protein
MRQVESVPPLTRHSSEKGLEKSYRKPKIDALEPLLEPIRLRRYKASRQKWECPRCPFTWMAGKPDFGCGLLSLG